MMQIKKMTALLAATLCIFSLAATACGGNDNTDSSSSSAENGGSSSASSESESESGKTWQLENDFVKIGNYSNIAAPVTAVTDEDVDKFIQQVLEANADTAVIVDRDVVEAGDVANIDYEGTMDGVTFEGGSARATDLHIGSNTFIAGFEEGIIGMKVGETKVLHLTFPEDYYEDKAGKAVDFSVTVNAIQTFIVPELSDGFVQNVSTQSKTVEEFQKEIHEYLTSNAKQNRDQQIVRTLMSDITYVNVPQERIDVCTEELTRYYKYVAETNSLTLDEYLTQNYGFTEKEFPDQIADIVTENVKRDLVVEAIAEAENITVTDQEMEKQIQEMVDANQFESKDEVLNYYTDRWIKSDILYNSVMEFVCNSAVEA